MPKNANEVVGLPKNLRKWNFFSVKGVEFFLIKNEIFERLQTVPNMILKHK